MGNIKTMMVVLCILALLTTTIFLSMHVYVQGKFASLTQLIPSKQSAKSISEVKKCNVTGNNLLGNISDMIHFDRDPPSWEEIIQEHSDILPGDTLY